MGLVDQRRNSVKNTHTMIIPLKVCLCFYKHYFVVVIGGSHDSYTVYLNFVLKVQP